MQSFKYRNMVDYTVHDVGKGKTYQKLSDLDTSLQTGSTTLAHNVWYERGLGTTLSSEWTG